MDLTIPQQIYQAVQQIETSPETHLLDWKTEVWETQWNIDHRLRKLFQPLSRDIKDNFYDSIILNPYIPHVPFYQQCDYILSPEDEVLYGGAVS